MGSAFVVDLFAEDRGHEAFLTPLIQRVADEEAVPIEIRSRSARGGHGRAISEFKLYQRLVAKGAPGATFPDLLIVAIDGNCASFAAKRREIEGAAAPGFSERLVAACPDPHVECWYVADPDSFHVVVGSRPDAGEKKCDRDHYKGVLAQAVREGGHPPTLGGLEFAPELVAAMDLYRASKRDSSLHAFLGDLRGTLRQLKTTGDE